MPLKIEHLKSFLGMGFGDGTRRSEYYYSSGLRYKRGGLEPGWQIVESANSSTAGCLYMGLFQGFDERDEAGTVYIYGQDDSGDLFKVQDGLTTWARDWAAIQTGHGNGIIVDHSNSQRVLYAHDYYLGCYDGAVHYDSWKHFKWNQNIQRHPDIYEDWVVFPNGSTVALLNITDDSWNHSAFTMPPKFLNHIARSGRSGVLLGANFNNRGVLILWDCQSNRSIAPWLWTKGEIQGIAKYNGIWLVSTGREIILTNGYAILKKYTFPDIEGTYNFGPNIPNGMKVEDDKLLILSATPSYNRNKNGLYILDLITGLWEFCPVSTQNTYSNSETGALFLSSGNKRYVSFRDTFLTAPQEYVGTIEDSATSSVYIGPALGTKSNAKKKAEALILSLNFALQDYESYDSPDWNIIIKLYNFNRPLWVYGAAKSTSASAWSIPVDGTVSGYNKTEVGDEITILEGANAGAIRHITVIDRKGAANELWTLDKALNAAIEVNARMNIMPFKKVGQKRITIDEIKDQRLYIPIQKTVVGRKFLAKLVIEPTEMRPHIEDMAFLYEELGNL